MTHLTLVRHGQSDWNEKNLFTGWENPGLTKQGLKEARETGEALKEIGLTYSHLYTSVLDRAIDTANIILDVLQVNGINTVRDKALNERDYGDLTGLNKDEMKKTYGEKKIHEFRRSWDTPPDPLSKNNPYHPINIDIYKDVPLDNIPDTESLKDTYNRVLPYFKKEIQNKLDDNKNILIAAHGNSIRAICKFLFQLDNKKITQLEIPTGNPLLISFNEKNKIIKCFYLDKERAKNLIVF